jgi:hypothetical protein
LQKEYYATEIGAKDRRALAHDAIGEVGRIAGVVEEQMWALAAVVPRVITFAQSGGPKVGNFH